MRRARPYYTVGPKLEPILSAACVCTLPQRLRSRDSTPSISQERASVLSRAAEFVRVHPLGCQLT